MGHAKALDLFGFFHPFSLVAVSKTLSDKECVTLNKFKLERRKGIFTYEWLDNVDKHNNTEVPPDEAFYSMLIESGITDKEYQQAIDCWNKTGCKTIKDYMMLCLKTDALLSVDVFEKFRDKCFEYYEKKSFYIFIHILLLDIPLIHILLLD